MSLGLLSPNLVSAGFASTGLSDGALIVAELSSRLHMPSSEAPCSIARLLCSTSPVTLAVFSRTTESALIWPLTTPQTRTVSACKPP